MNCKNFDREESLDQWEKNLLNFLNDVSTYSYYEKVKNIL